MSAEKSSGKPAVLMCHGAPPPPTASAEERRKADEARDAAAGADRAPPKENTVVLKRGDLLRASEKYICHQCNCVSKHAKGERASSCGS